MGTPRDITHTFPGSGQVSHEIAGRYIRVIAATGDVYVRLGGGSEVRAGAGQALDSAGKFTRFSLRSTVAQTVQVRISDTPQDDNTQTVTANVTATVAAGVNVVSAADASVAASTASQVLAGNANRLTAIIKNLASNTDPIRVGDSSVSATQGHELMPGESVALDSTSSIYVYNLKAGGAQSVSLLEVRSV